MGGGSIQINDGPQHCPVAPVHADQFLFGDVQVFGSQVAVVFSSITARRRSVVDVPGASVGLASQGKDRLGAAGGEGGLSLGQKMRQSLDDGQAYQQRQGEGGDEAPIKAQDALSQIEAGKGNCNDASVLERGEKQYRALR